jgi:hypothetical protein
MTSNEAAIGNNEALMARNNFKQRVTSNSEQSGLSGAKKGSSELSGANTRQK